MKLITMELWVSKNAIPQTISRKDKTLRWRHNDHAGVSNHQPPGCLLNRLFRRKSKKTSKLRVTGLCAGNSPGTGEFSAQMASYAENVSIWWRHHEMKIPKLVLFYVCLCHLCTYSHIYTGTIPGSVTSFSPRASIWKIYSMKFAFFYDND